MDTYLVPLAARLITLYCAARLIVLLSRLLRLSRHVRRTGVYPTHRAVAQLGRLIQQHNLESTHAETHPNYYRWKGNYEYHP